MKFTENTRRILACHREARDMRAAGYRRHETDWEIHRGGRHDEVILDAKVSVDGKHVWTKIGPPNPSERPLTLSEWDGWDEGRPPWSAAKHQDEVMAAVFRGGWAMEDATVLIGFINRTWGKPRRTDG